MEKLVGGWDIDGLAGYLALVLVFSLAIRAFLTMLRAIEQAHQADGGLAVFVAFWRTSFVGFHPDDPDNRHSDYWQPFIIGSLELSAYPVLMATGAWTAVGAWIGLKTISQWNVWSSHREAFNRFLIGNALNLLVAALLLTPFVTLK
ncbi:MAG: hypothetical protein MI824_15050 [Hyphomicrobiales bacterium]|nr:hypothetical protein [Hyphomicrobiales bacterium]